MKNNKKPENYSLRSLKENDSKGYNLLIHALQGIYFAKKVMQYIKIDPNTQIAAKGSYNALLIFSLQFIGSALEKLPRYFTQNKKELSKVIFSGKDTNNQQRCWLMADRRNGGHMLDITKAFASDLTANTIAVIKSDLEAFEKVICLLLSKNERENAMQNITLPTVSYVSSKSAESQTNGVNIYNAIVQMEKCMKSYDTSIAHQIIAAGCIMVVGNNMKLFDISEFATQEKLYNTTIEWRNFIAHLNGLSELSAEKDNMKAVMQECIAQKKYFQPPQQVIQAPVSDNDATPSISKKKKKKKAVIIAPVVHQSKRRDMLDVDDDIWSNNKIVGDSPEISKRILALVNASNQKRGLEQYDLVYKITEEDIVHALIMHSTNREDMVFLLKHLNGKFDINYAFKGTGDKGKEVMIPFVVTILSNDNFTPNDVKDLLFYFVTLGYNIAPEKEEYTRSMWLLGDITDLLSNYNWMKKLCLLSNDAGIKLNAGRMINNLLLNRDHLDQSIYQLIAYMQYQPYILTEGVKIGNKYASIFHAFTLVFLDNDHIQYKDILTAKDFIVNRLIPRILHLNKITGGELNGLVSKLLSAIFKEFNNPYDLTKVFYSCYLLSSIDQKNYLRTALEILSGYNYIFANDKNFPLTIAYINEPIKDYNDAELQTLLVEATSQHVTCYTYNLLNNKNPLKIVNTAISFDWLNNVYSEKFKPLLKRFMSTLIQEFTTETVFTFCQTDLDFQKVHTFRRLCIALSTYPQDPVNLQTFLSTSQNLSETIDGAPVYCSNTIGTEILSNLIDAHKWPLEKVLVNFMGAGDLWTQYVEKESNNEGKSK